MRRERGTLRSLLLLALLLAPLAAAGCAGKTPEPAAAPPPGGGPVATSPATALQEAAAPDTTTPDTAAPPNAAYTRGWRYRFNMTSPSNERNAITERELYLYFWPDTTRIWFQVENRIGTPMKILWNDMRFRSPDGESYKIVHQGIDYLRRNNPLDYTLVAGLQRYSDWIAPVDLLEDPSAAQGGGMRLLLPTDASSQGFVGKSFGADFVVEVEGVPRTYSLSFKIESVLPPQ